MAGYCAVSDVEYDAQQLNITFATDTIPTLAAVQSWILEVAEEINSILRSAGIDMDTVTANDYLKQLNMYGVSARVYSVKIVGGEGSDNTARDYRAKKYKDGLAELRADPLISGGTMASSSSTDLARSDFTSNFTNSRTKFTRDGREW